MGMKNIFGLMSASLMAGLSDVYDVPCRRRKPTDNEFTAYCKRHPEYTADDILERVNDKKRNPFSRHTADWFRNVGYGALKNKENESDNGSK